MQVLGQVLIIFTKNSRGYMIQILFLLFKYLCELSQIKIKFQIYLCKSVLNKPCVKTVSSIYH